ncbi:mobilization protein [Rhizobium sp. SEMIA 439]|jgi:anti-anti-sigma regulatory factor|nr:mobilization protein [Rhizobium sp. SEMIA 439]
MRPQSKGTIVARKTIEQRLAELDAQRSALKTRLSKTERNNDMRRKVLIGSLVLHHLETSNDQEFSKQLGAWLRRELPGFLTRDNDKALFADLIGQGLTDKEEGGDSVEGHP